MTIVLLAICASAIGVCVALMYGVHNRFPPLHTLMAASGNRTLQPGYDVTPAIGTNDGGGDEDEEEEEVLCYKRNCSSQASVVELNDESAFGGCSSKVCYLL